MLRAGLARNASGVFRARYNRVAAGRDGPLRQTLHQPRGAVSRTWSTRSEGSTAAPFGRQRRSASGDSSCLPVSSSGEAHPRRLRSSRSSHSPPTKPRSPSFRRLLYQSSRLRRRCRPRHRATGGGWASRVSPILGTERATNRRRMARADQERGHSLLERTHGYL